MFPEVDHATTAIGIAEEDDILTTRAVVHRRGDAQQLGLHDSPPAVLVQQLLDLLCVRLAEAKCPSAWEDLAKNGAGDGDRTHDIQLGKLTFDR